MPTARSETSVLQIANVIVRFGGIVAVRDLSLKVQTGEVLGLIGPNGAGKSTVFNVISGLYRPAGGSIRFRGNELVEKKPHQIAALGVARTFQNLQLFRGLSVLENVLVGRHLGISAGLLAQAMNTRSARAQDRQAREEADEILAFVGLDTAKQFPVGQLSLGQQKIVELARALAVAPKLLLLDEPVGGMNTQEKGQFGHLLRKIHRRWDLTVIVIDHDMSLVCDVCDRLAVMDFGELIAQGTPEEIQHNERVIVAYLGKDVDA